MWIDVASIVFVCVTANHLGLIEAVEDIAGTRLPIVNCVKCFTFWLTLFYMLFATYTVIPSLAISFLASYIAVWLELFEGIIDTYYKMLYDKIYDKDAV